MSFQKIFSNNWFLALIILGLFLTTNRYIYGWDDQHLEIPLLKHLIDPTLYQGDYYVESLKQNFTSYLYPLLSKIIIVDQIPAVYFILYLLSRYFLFFFSLKLWGKLSNSRETAFVCVLMSFLIGRTEEFLYRTFSHQEFALAIIMAGLYFFFSNRLILSACLFGVAANFNAIYALYPMMYLGVYILIFDHKSKIKKLIQSSLGFIICALPFLFWTFTKKHSHLDANVYAGWIDLFLKACPQNFPFQNQPLSEVFHNFASVKEALGPYIFLVVLYVFNLIFNLSFRKNKMAQAVSVTTFLLLVACYVFSYIYPNRFAIDLNLIRNIQYLNFLLMGFTTLWFFESSKDKRDGRLLWFGVVLIFLNMGNWFSILFMAAAAIIFFLYRALKDKNYFLMNVVEILVLAGIFYIIHPFLKYQVFKFQLFFINFVLIACLYFILLILKKSSCGYNKLFIYIPLMLMFIYFCRIHYNYVQITTKGQGFWQLQRNWEDMQKFVKENTPKEAIIFVPYNMEMCGFRIGAERKIVVSYRDCGIIGFDYGAVLEWQKRIKDVEAFKVMTNPGSIMPAVINAVEKYHSDYVVFMKYYAPPDNQNIFKRMYSNEVFALYKVNKN